MSCLLVGIDGDRLFDKMYEGRTIGGLVGGQDIKGDCVSSRRIPNRESRVSWALAKACWMLANGKVSQMELLSYQDKVSPEGVSVNIEVSPGKHVCNAVVYENYNFVIYSRSAIGGHFTYQAGLAVAAYVLLHHTSYPDFVQALRNYLICASKKMDTTNALARLSDELLFDLVAIAHCQEVILKTESPAPSNFAFDGATSLCQAFSNLDELNAFVGSKIEPISLETRVYGEQLDTKFVGNLPLKLKNDIMRGADILVSGPTGTGKSLAVDEACANIEAPVVRLKGYEGLEDRDIIGTSTAKDGSVFFIDGPLVEWYRLGNKQYLKQLAEDKLAIDEGRASVRVPPAVFFLDEANRLRTRHQNLFLGAITVDYRHNLCTFKVPDTQETLTCHPDFLVLVAARNVGGAYVGVNAMDPAFVRRFRKKYDVGYLDSDKELDFVVNSTGLSKQIASVIVSVASDTRYDIPDLKAPIDSSTLLYWAQELAMYENCGLKISMEELLLSAKDIVYEVCIRRDETGKYASVSELLLTDSLGHNWSEVTRS